MADMGEAELKVVLAVTRKTIGWHKTRDRLSFSQLMELTGLSRQGVSDGTAAAVERGVIARYPVGNSFEYELVVNEVDQPETVNEIDRPSQPSRPILPKNGQPSRHTKETLKQTNQNKDSGEAAPDPWEQEFSPGKPEPTRVPVGQEFESPKRKKDERQVHPAAKLYRQRMHLYVNRDWVDELIRVVGDTPEKLAKWDELLRAWNGHGWKPGNIAGMLDAFKAGGINGRGAKNTGGIKYNAEEAKRKALEAMGAG
ncbi:MAG: replication protein [Anaerolineales bacterium]|nr:MAG: replication protein [Anaerolineales bacterium]